MYTDTNFKTKKALKEAVKAHQTDDLSNPGVGYFQPGGMFPTPTNGHFVVEGPQYPKPHRWYAQCVAKDGVIISVK